MSVQQIQSLLAQSGSSSQPNPASPYPFTPLQDIKLQTIDFPWIASTTKISHLKRAIKLIEMDGNFYTQLKDACYKRIGELDPTQKKIQIDNKVSHEDREKMEKELEEWEAGVKNSDKEKYGIFQKQSKGDQFDPETYFTQDPNKRNNTKQAQNQRNKGNEAIKSKDYPQAIRYYTKSIQLDPTMSQSYCNRALAYLKQKNFQLALSDCQTAISLNPQYTKAHHRKSKALIGLKNRVEAYGALQEALKIEPDNAQCLTQLRDLRQEMNEEEKSVFEGKSQFKKILIQQEEEDEEVEQK